MKSTIDMARESHLDVYGLGKDHAKFVDTLKAFEALVRADERTELMKLLEGIDKTQAESDEGWWETSTGAKFGSSILNSIRARGETK